LLIFIEAGLGARAEQKKGNERSTSNSDIEKGTGCGQCGMERSEDGGGNKERTAAASLSK
jgi:hypothetical protein